MRRRPVASRGSGARRRRAALLAAGSVCRVIEAALVGKDVIITRGTKPAVRMVAIPQGRFKVGLLEGQATGPDPDFLELMDEDRLALWEGRG